MSAKKILSEKTLEVSAPSRLELGGTWDIKGFALTYEWIQPCTVNIAINLRTHVKLTPHTKGKIKLSNDVETVEYALENADFTDSFKLLATIATHFGIDGYHAHFFFDAPQRAGLGGSGVIAVVFCAALQKLKYMIEGKGDTPDTSTIVYLAHSIEDSLRFSITGLQDQCAAAYGGVNYWEWHYSQAEKYTRTEILKQNEHAELEKRILVAYLRPHDSNDINSLNIESFFDPRERQSWFVFNQNTKRFANALKAQNWKAIIALLKQEDVHRETIAPGRLIPVGKELQKIAEQFGASLSVCGAGSGGCVWAICPNEKIKETLEQKFTSIIGQKNILPIKIDSKGLQYKITTL